jgi:erythromycin esterase-like protein
LCDKQVALLGEAAGHGDGHTEAFKVRLIRELVTRCGYNAVFFEASHYEFLDLERSLRLGQPLTAERVGQAVGGVWKFEREVQPLLPFLATEANEGRLYLGGLDGQLGGLEEPYANDIMPERLTGVLSEPLRTQCRVAMHRRIYWDYTEAAPYNAADKQFLLACISEIARTIPYTDAIQQQELTNLDRFLRLDQTDTATLIAGRDQAMYQNFRWLADQLGSRAKIIVWTATAHAAKDARAYPPFAKVKSLGAYVHETYGDKAFALGFSARSGAYRWSRKENKPVAPAQDGSLEASAGVGLDTVYLDRKHLQKLGVVPGGSFDHVARPVDWGAALDGVVVFYEERPPHSTRPGYD